MGLWLILAQLGVTGCAVERGGPPTTEPILNCPAGDEYTAVRGVFRGACASAVPSWTELRYDGPVTPSDEIKIAGLCNPNGYTLKLTLRVEGSDEEVILGPNECSDPYEAGVQYALVVPLDQNLILASECSTMETSPPPDIYVDLFIACKP
ncbi:MAG: hypothetical protein DCC55_19920 [Chloroflexi bacterium]|nr:MAG: hypothetical protein DCC55_19920 [Chloroflexota bacterium]